MEENTIDGEVVSNEAETEETGFGFNFADRFVQKADDLKQIVLNRIKAHEEKLTEEELELWELRLQGVDTKTLETRIEQRRTLIQMYVQEHNSFFTPESQASDG